jgi:hypothetical protein
VEVVGLFNNQSSRAKRRRAKLAGQPGTGAEYLRASNWDRSYGKQ